MRPLHSILLLLAACVPPLRAVDAQILRRRERALPDRESLEHGGRTRTYIVRVPARAASTNSPVPLVIVLHGGGGNAINAERMTGFTAKAEREGFIVAYPDGTSRGRLPLYTWNAKHCCGYAMQDRVDDVGFIGALIDRLQATYRIDPDRVYVTGMSNGGMMSHRVGAELSSRIAAVAPVVGAIFGDELQPRVQVSAIIINGRADPLIPYNGGPSGGRTARAWDGAPTKPATAQAEFWALADGCREPTSTNRPGYDLREYSCPGTLGVAMYTITDGKHAWPGGAKGSRRADAPSTAINATDVIWEFFKAHPKH